MKNWSNIKTESDFINLCRYGKPDTRVKELYERLEDELIDVFGVSDNYQKQLKLKINISLIYAKMVATSDKSLKLQAYVLEKELIKFDSKPSIHNLHDSIIAMNKQGIQADINTITVFDFYSFANSLNKVK